MHIRRKQRGLPYALLLSAVMFALTMFIKKWGGNGGHENLLGEEEENHRVLSGGGTSSDGECSLPMLPNAMGGKNAGNAIVSGFFTLWSFVGIAIICDDFFQPSLEKISEVLDLTPDVAGATFLAAGSSAPELFTSLADAFGDASSIGMGTIVGSAMFNILVIVALSSAVAGKSGASLQIDYRPVARDVFFYSYSILLLAIFFADGVIVLYEATIMWVSYLLYIGFMKYNQKILGKCAPPHPDAYKVTPDGEKEAEAAAQSLENGSGPHGTEGTEDFSSVNDKPAEGDSSSKPEEKQEEGKEEGGSGQKSEEEEEEEEDGNKFALPENAADWPLYCLSIPFVAIFTITVPDCTSKRFENWYAVSFFMSIVWIGVLCHVMVEFAVGIACICEIDPIVMGVLVLAVGTSVPDAIGSMIAARNGEADMAIANAIGSNVFDVLLGLGLPWFLAIIIKDENFAVCKEGIGLAVVILFCTVILFVAVLALNKWKMNTNVGLGLFVLYGVYVVYTIVSAASKGKSC